MSDDEFGDDWPSFTKSDWDTIDALSQPEASNSARDSSTVANDIEDASVSPPVTKQSPLQRHRSKSILYVTDLSSPMWCEVQFDYGLRQKRWLEPQQRPSTLTLESGKELPVDKEVAAANHETVTQGKRVHKALEREVRGEEIPVATVTNEERWAVRLLNMMSSLQHLALQGRTREMPVFGLLHGQVVVGVIDEITREPVEPAPVVRDSKRLKTSSKQASSGQSPIAGWLNSTSQATADVGSPSRTPPRHTLKIIDTKTRLTPILPSSDNASSSRMQLMLYHRLFSGLISSTAPFNFVNIWDRVKVDPTLTFSSAFCAEARHLLTSETREMTCLDHLAAQWGEAIQALHGCDVARQMKIVYRFRPKVTQRREKQKMQSPGLSREELELALAIEASLGSSSGAQAVPESIATAANGSVADETTVESSGIPQQSQSIDTEESDHGGESSVSTEFARKDSSPLVKKRQKLSWEIIGETVFEMDDEALDAHVIDVLSWWNGQRPPRGVEPHHTRRCDSCEYRKGCEWREQKAEEAIKACAK